MRTNYILIDFENVQPSSFSTLKKLENYKIIFFIGANQAKLSFDTVEQIHKLGEKADYLKISGNGSNALDFHIAYYIGRLAAEEPNSYFHIISKDTGFDPLIQHLKNKKIYTQRSQSIEEMSVFKEKAALSNDIQSVISNLKQRKASKPNKLKTLCSTINSLFQKSLSEQEILNIVSKMEKMGFISIRDTKITYHASE